MLENEGSLSRIALVSRVDFAADKLYRSPAMGCTMRKGNPLKGTHLSGIIFLLALCGCHKKISEPNYPALGVVVTATESTLCVYRDDTVDFILYHPAPFKNWSWNDGSPEMTEPHLWEEKGHLELGPDYDEVEVSRKGTMPDKLFLNDQQFELRNGRVFRISDSQTFDQMQMNTGAIKSDVDLEMFSEKLWDYLSKRQRTLTDVR